MRLAGQYAPDRPTIPDMETRRLRAKLIMEEAAETARGLGFEVGITWGCETLEPDLIEIADGCWDIIVVTTGTLSSCGIDDLEGQEAVDLGNLKKFGPGHKIREDGKIIKPPDFKHPDIGKILDNQGDR